MDRKVVLITGASSGIGYETAILFAKNNYNVVINYLNSKDSATNLQELLISSYNVLADTIKCDISCEEDVKKMVDFVINKYGRIDVLVNNAGICSDTLLEDKTVSSFRHTIDVNLTGTFIVSKYVSDVFKKQGFGNIVNISSTNAIDTYYPESIDYDASKAGVISLTHNFAKYLAPNIRVNAICPGWIDTRMNKYLDLKQKEDYCNGILLHRFGKAEEVAKVIYFVANDATYINDAIIRVDGGSKC